MEKSVYSEITSFRRKSFVSTTDALAKVTNYGYNEDTGVLDWVQYPEDTEATHTEYTYDSKEFQSGNLVV